MVYGTKSDTVISILKKLPRSLRLKVKEITIDLSPSMKLIAKCSFPNATIVSDRFHVQKLMNEAINDLRVEKLNVKFFKFVVETMENNHETIVNYFDNRATNAAAESFNAKVKAFRSQFRGQGLLQAKIQSQFSPNTNKMRVNEWRSYTKEVSSFVLFHTVYYYDLIFNV